MISSTCFGYSVLKVSKCCFKAPARRNGDCTSPNKAFVDLKAQLVMSPLSNEIEVRHDLLLESALARRFA